MCDTKVTARAKKSGFSFQNEKKDNMIPGGFHLF